MHCGENLEESGLRDWQIREHVAEHHYCHYLEREEEEQEGEMAIQQREARERVVSEKVRRRSLSI